MNHEYFVIGLAFGVFFGSGVGALVVGILLHIAAAAVIGADDE